jgi:murein DD-endopeptidase MepM/ murein hydrolase activator NlpD
LLAAALLGFVLGAFLVGSLSHANALAAVPPEAESRIARAVDEPPGAAASAPAPTSGRAQDVAPESDDTKDLTARKLTIPVQGVGAAQLTHTFHDARSGGREHEALDILAPRNTPVIAVEDGTIAKLFLSKAGGTTIYQFDPSREYAYYYAHLEHYADGLAEGALVRRGQIIGYVGTSGNAPKDTPHLHFAIFRLTAAKHWWEGTAIDPYGVLR